MKTVAILGRKGGSGKSSLSHFLGHGISTGIRELTGDKFTTILLRTDNRTSRPSDIVDKRKYMLASVPGDESDIKFIEDVVTFTKAIENSFLIVDGGANRRRFDFAACEIADLVLIPTGCSEEDVETADADYDELSAYIAERNPEAEVYLIRYKWPGVKRKYDALMEKNWIKRYLKKWNAEGILFPHIIPDMPSFLDLANAENPTTTLLLNKLSTSFAQVIAKKVGLELGQLISDREEPAGDGQSGDEGGYVDDADYVREETKKVA